MNSKTCYKPLGVFLLCVIGLSGCVIRDHFRAEDTRIKISTLIKYGMPKEELVSILGEAYKIDRPRGDTELMFYETNTTAGSYCRQYTPIQISDGKVAGWGETFCKEPIASALEERIDSHLKQ